MNRVRTVFPLKSHSKNPLTETTSADYTSFDSFLWCLMCWTTKTSGTAIYDSIVSFSWSCDAMIKHDYIYSSHAILKTVFEILLTHYFAERCRNFI